MDDSLVALKMMSFQLKEAKPKNPSHNSLSLDNRMYVMVIGGCLVRPDDRPLIKVHKMVDLSAFPDREAVSYLEVLPAYQLFYKRLIED